MTISALILTKNESEMIGDCIKQLNFVEEIIIIDQNSTDSTVKIARDLGVKVFSTQSNRFDVDRNALKDKSKCEWLLYVDADERLSQEVITEIKDLISENKHSAYYLARQNYILGKWLKHGGWWPDYVPRLFRKKDLISWEGEVHESPRVRGTFGYAKNPIRHETARSISKMLEKTTKWAQIEANLYAKHKTSRVTKLKILKAMIMEFTRRYFIKLGFLDGMVGFIQAAFQSLHAAAILTYLWEIENRTDRRSIKIENE